MEIKEFLKKDRLSELLGVKLLEVSNGKAKAGLVINTEHLNGLGIAHGGAIFSLADFAFAAASNSHGNIAVGINANINFVKAAGKGLLIADAFEVSRSCKLATYTVNITDTENDLIATFQGTVYRKKDIISDISC